MGFRRRVAIRTAHPQPRRRMCATAVLLSLCAVVPGLSAQITTTVRIDSAVSAGSDTFATRVNVAIQHPDVRAPSQSFPQISLRPGDRWLLDAEGCVQTGGVGKTWKRYVNPLGPGTDRLYHAWVRVLDGAPPSRLESVIGREQIIPTAADPASLHFTLGYIDDDYTDNGYNDHDDGTEQQCVSQGNARLSLTIIRAHHASLATVAASTSSAFTCRRNACRPVEVKLAQVRCRPPDAALRTAT